MSDEEDTGKTLVEWEAELNGLSAESEQMVVPANVKGKRVDRELLGLAFMSAFDAVGGVPRLAQWMDSNYSEAVKTMARMLPKEVTNTHSGEVTIKHALPRGPLDGEYSVIDTESGEPSKQVG